MSSPSLEKKTSPPDHPTWWHRSLFPVRKAIIRGLAIIMPPLLTIVLFLWAWNIIDSYVLGPVEVSCRNLIVWVIGDFRDDATIQAEIRAAPTVTQDPDSSPQIWTADDGVVLSKVNKTWIPKEVVDVVESNPGTQQPQTAQAYYHRFVQVQYLPRYLVIPAFLIVFLVALYLLGRIFAAGVGRLIWTYAESAIHRLPVISNVYSAVKQVTDFAFSDSEIHFTRVVAVEYPRRGVWSMGFVTGESMLDIRNAANEPVLSVLMPTSPMPATGFVISVPKSQTIDLNITIDQAIQFCVSCGVVVPTNQQQPKPVTGLVTAQHIQPDTPPEGDGQPAPPEPPGIPEDDQPSS